ncbi:unnamed protein product [Adineta steineri]|uniref:Uncharacterized protein n=1 Tax=Adineta steineri TaxID=433720 RepID=A0A815UQP1_9BILA|nr:unnamed protein product [Adineta steineri]CAF1522693.1 unnamed protein product [Adineta steineri]
MNISSTLSNLYLNEYYYEPSTFSAYTTNQLYYNYQYNANSTSILNYSANNYNLFNHDFLYSQEPTVNTIKIHINPFFKPRSSHHTSESSTDLQQPQHNLSVPSRSQSRSLSFDRQVITSTNKESKVVIQRKQLKSKHRRTAIDRSEKKKDKLKRLYKEYSDENVYEHWKPLRTQQCSELCQYALDKYHQIE